MNFVDKYGLYHHKPCVNDEPSSNNGWLYTSIAKHLGFPIAKSSLQKCFLSCLRSISPLQLDRLPGKKEPPISRDEILGMVSLGLLDVKHLEENYWQFCNLDGFVPKSLWQLNWWEVVKSLWRIRKSHRNALWDSDYWNEKVWVHPDHLHIGFRLTPQDTYYMLKKSGRRANPIHFIYFYISTYLSGNSLIPWLKLKDLGWENTRLFKRIDLHAALVAEFPIGHLFLDVIPSPHGKNTISSSL